MSRDEKQNSPEFVAYMEMIVRHPNYRGLKINRNSDGTLQWVAAKNSAVGVARQTWIDRKATELGIPVEPGSSAKVMRMIHPTKEKPCQICGRMLSLYYVYPNANFLRAIKKQFGCTFNNYDHIDDVWDTIVVNGFDEDSVKRFFVVKFDLDESYFWKARKEILDECERVSREEGKGNLGPGVMSNPPDRFDGFHSYNRCCRSIEDKGRHSDNMKSYTKDRRAYEYWSDGNIHAADEFMGSAFFDGTSADHVGPISLGFIHDPRYLQQMPSGENSTKRNRLRKEDIVKILRIEGRTGIYPMSWQSSLLWEEIKTKYSCLSDAQLEPYRDMLLQNMSNYMYVLYTLIHRCEKGKEYIVSIFLKPKFGNFAKTYRFNELGDIIAELPRHYTERNQYEIERFIRIAFSAVDEFVAKENRQHTANLTIRETDHLMNICQSINAHANLTQVRNSIQTLMKEIQLRLIHP